MMKIWNKRLAGMLAALLLAVVAPAILALPVSAADDLPRLSDMADLLSDSEESELSDLLDEISERQQVDIVVVTVESMEGETAEVYADDFFDYNGYGFGDERDGILFLISMAERDWHITTRGYGITAVTDAGREYIAEEFQFDLSEGEYAAAFTTFANLCDDFITQAKNGQPYDIDNMPTDPVTYFAGNFILAFAIAFVIALIATGMMRLQLKSVFGQSTASDYMKQGSLQLTKKNDLFLYKKVERKKKEQESKPVSTAPSSPPRPTGGSKTHISSSGAKHGGGGGKF